VGGRAGWNGGGAGTDGDAVLPLPAMHGVTMLEIHLHGTLDYVVSEEDRQAAWSCGRTGHLTDLHVCYGFRTVAKASPLRLTLQPWAPVWCLRTGPGWRADGSCTGAPCQERRMSDPDRNTEQSLRDAAYFIWERDGRPEGRARDHWERAIIETSGYDQGHADHGLFEEEEKILAGRPDANMPALLTKDVAGG
jgi:hypothetical protein